MLRLLGGGRAKGEDAFSAPARTALASRRSLSSANTVNTVNTVRRIWEQGLRTTRDVERS
jgi:hypothetical protein